MAAELRMARDVSAGEREAYVDGIIARLGLAKVRDSEGAGGWAAQRSAGATARLPLLPEGRLLLPPKAAHGAPARPPRPLDRPPTRRWATPRRGG